MILGTNYAYTNSTIGTLIDEPIIELTTYRTNIWKWHIISVIPIILMFVINYLKSNNHKKSLIMNIASIILWLIFIVIVPKEYVVCSSNTTWVPEHIKIRLVIASIIYIIALTILIINLIFNIIQRKRQLKEQIKTSKGEN